MASPGKLIQYFFHDFHGIFPHTIFQMMYLNVTYTQKDQMTESNDQKWTSISFGSDTLLTDDLSQFQIEPPSDGPAFDDEKKDLRHQKSLFMIRLLFCDVILI